MKILLNKNTALNCVETTSFIISMLLNQLKRWYQTLNRMRQSVGGLLQLFTPYNQVIATNNHKEMGIVSIDMVKQKRIQVREQCELHGFNSKEHKTSFEELHVITMQCLKQTNQREYRDKVRKG